MRLKRRDERMDRVRCAYCRKPTSAGSQAIASYDGLLFDSSSCKERYIRRGTLEALSNVTRVARSRLKTRTIGKAESVYRTLGGRDWSTVRMLLSAVL